jgi:hypothetical protein
MGWVTGWAPQLRVQQQLVISWVTGWVTGWQPQVLVQQQMVLHWVMGWGPQVTG